MKGANETLWAQTFGDEYTVRNDRDYSNRRMFFMDLFSTGVSSLLEVGCNAGMNLDLLSSLAIDAWGCDVNSKALAMCRKRFPGINVVRTSGFDIVFKDKSFDCVMTAGVLIHQRPEEVEVMMQEIIRVSRKYVLAIEYYSPTFEEIPYRGNAAALFKGPYGEIYEKRYGLKLIRTGFLGKEGGFDDCTWWLLSRY